MLALTFSYPAGRNDILIEADLAATTCRNAMRLRYRSDIDGLRALAVLAVIVFHKFPKVLPGGFVGVDIFFVISGYRISHHPNYPRRDRFWRLHWLVVLCAARAVHFPGTDRCSDRDVCPRLELLFAFGAYLAWKEHRCERGVLRKPYVAFAGWLFRCGRALEAAPTP